MNLQAKLPSNRVEPVTLLWEKFTKFWDNKSGNWLQDTPDRFPDVFSHNPVAFCGRMDTIGLVQIRHSADTFQEEGDQKDFIFICQLTEDGTETVCILISHIGGYAHPCQNNLCGRVFLSDFVYDPLQVFFGGCQGKPPQSVIAPQFKYKDIHPLVQDPVDTTVPPG